MSDGLLRGLFIVPILAFLILIHEIGHFASARAVGVKVEEFGIGIPPRLKGWRRNGVIWSINWIPFGGFVRVLGEDGKNMDPGSMNTKGPLQRAFFLVAGSAMNILFVVLAMLVIIAFQGQPTDTARAFITSVVPDSPAEQAQLAIGDRILSVDGTEIETGNEIRSAAAAAAGRAVDFVIERDGTTLTVPVTPRQVTTENEGPTGILLTFEPTFEPVPASEVVPLAFSQSWRLAVFTFDGLRQLLTGNASFSSVAGPVGMGQAVSESLAVSSLPIWVMLAQISAVISFNLALLNLLPLPALDGGRLLFVFVELLRGGRRVAPEREGLVHFAGLVLLLGLMFVIAFRDIDRLVDGRSFLP